MLLCCYCERLANSMLTSKVYCRYVGNIHPQVTDPLLREVFTSTGLIEGCKLIKKEKVGYFLFSYNFS